MPSERAVSLSEVNSPLQMLPDLQLRPSDAPQEFTNQEPGNQQIAMAWLVRPATACRPASACGSGYFLRKPRWSLPLALLLAMQAGVRVTPSLTKARQSAQQPVESLKELSVGQLGTVAVTTASKTA